jgi:hypothetical protein
MREVRELLGRRAGQRVERVRLAAARGVVHVVEERPHLRAGERRGLVGHELYHALELELRGERGADPLHRVDEQDGSRDRVGRVGRLGGIGGRHRSSRAWHRARPETRRTGEPRRTRPNADFPL